jgi:hypothetical protein
MENKSTAFAQRRRINRRQFLQMMGIAFVGGSLAACGAPRSRIEVPPVDVTFRPYPILPSPQPPVDAVPTPTGAATELSLEEFLALSAVLTGFENLDPVLGSVYLQSLQTSEQFAITVAEVYEQAGLRTDAPPTSVEELEAIGVFEQEETRKLLDKIIEYWYTGIYETVEGEQAVATYVDALMWRAMLFTKPLTICGAPAFWAEPPETEID